MSADAAAAAATSPTPVRPPPQQTTSWLADEVPPRSQRDGRACRADGRRGAEGRARQPRAREARWRVAARARRTPQGPAGADGPRRQPGEGRHSQRGRPAQWAWGCGGARGEGPGLGIAGRHRVPAHRLLAQSSAPPRRAAGLGGQRAPRSRRARRPASCARGLSAREEAGPDPLKDADWRETLVYTPGGCRGGRSDFKADSGRVYRAELGPPLAERRRAFRILFYPPEV